MVINHLLNGMILQVDPSKWLSITQNSRVPQRLGACNVRVTWELASLKLTFEVQDTVGNWLYVG